MYSKSKKCNTVLYLLFPLASSNQNFFLIKMLFLAMLGAEKYDRKNIIQNKCNTSAYFIPPVFLSTIIQQNKFVYNNTYKP